MQIPRARRKVSISFWSFFPQSKAGNAQRMTARIETLWNLGGEKEDTEKKKKERKEDTENVYTAY